MGSEISTPYQPTGIHVPYQQQLFAEYRQIALSDPEIIQKDIEKWNSADQTIRIMTLEEQAEYCDPITTKLCEMSQEIIISSGEEIMRCIAYTKGTNYKWSTCAVANCAKTILSLPEGDLKEKLRSAFTDVLISH